ncbi:MAG: hypothetical protein HC821_04330 [Lewinella sp.]|nr:hypothetical protein [Lewinella sp.]
MLFIGLSSGYSLAQKTIFGVVTDEESFPLPGVNILVKGTTSGTVTDLDGAYQLTVSPGQTLVFSYTGFSTVERVVGPESNISLVLSSGRQLDEVVVTALGISREKKALGYAVQEIGTTEINRVQQPNLVNALQGQVAGVQISSAGVARPGFTDHYPRSKLPRPRGE